MHRQSGLDSALILYTFRFYCLDRALTIDRTAAPGFACETRPLTGETITVENNGPIHGQDTAIVTVYGTTGIALAQSGGATVWFSL